MGLDSARRALPDFGGKKLPEGFEDINDANLVILSDGRAGHQNQSVGVAEMLGFKDPEIFTLRRRGTGLAQRLLGLMPVDWTFENFEAVAREMARIRDPLVVIGAGTQVSRALRALKKARPGLFAVCMMRPAGKVRDFDVVAVCKHDHMPKADNVVETLGPANRITRERLEVEADRWRKRLSSVPNPRMAVLIGGASKHGGMAADGVRAMMEAALAVAKTSDLGLLVTTSRRTGPEATAQVCKELESAKVRHYFWSPDEPGQRDNPYLAYLAGADAVLVSADSVSMVCEAVSAGKPVYLWGDVKALPAKQRELFGALERQGRLKWWDGVLNLRPSAAGVMDTMMIAGFVRAKFGKKGF